MDDYCCDVYPLPLYMHKPHAHPTIRSIPLVSQADDLWEGGGGNASTEMARETV